MATKKETGEKQRIRVKRGDLTAEIAKVLAERNDAKLKALAKKLVTQATQGDKQAQSMVLDRIDGKVATTIAGDAERPITVVIKR